MTDERIIAYLLNELPEAELEEFEDECFAAESWPSLIDVVEEDLIDDYLRGELSPERRRSFEQHYLTTDARQQRVAMAAVLLRHVDERAFVAVPSPIARPNGQTWFERLRSFRSYRSWMPQAAVALATVFLVAGLWWLAVPRQHPSLKQSFEPLVLHASNSERAGGAQAGKAKLPRDGRGLKLFLIIPQSFASTASYHVQVESIDGEIKLSEMFARDEQSVPVEIPAALLTRGRYVAKLNVVKTDASGTSIARHYFFDVE
jgi:hypothetical protein